jgi:hypothetical protein
MSTHMCEKPHAKGSKLHYTSDRLYHWGSKLEEFGPKILWITGAERLWPSLLDYD